MNERMVSSVKHGRWEDPEVWEGSIAQATQIVVLHCITKAGAEFDRDVQILVQHPGMLRLPKPLHLVTRAQQTPLKLRKLPEFYRYNIKVVGDGKSSVAFHIDRDVMTINWRPPLCSVCGESLRERRRRGRFTLYCQRCGYRLRYDAKQMRECNDSRRTVTTITGLTSGRILYEG